MSYLGNPLSTAFSSRIKQDFASPSGTSFTMNQAVSDPNDISLYINHVRQEPGVAYTVDGSSTLTTTGTLTASDDMYIIYDELTIQTAEHPEGQALRCTSIDATDALSVSHGKTVDSVASFINTSYNENNNGVVHVKQSAGTNSPTMLIEQTGAGGNPGDTQGLQIKIAGQNQGTGKAIHVVTQNTNLNSGNAYNAFEVENGGNVNVYGNLAFTRSGYGIDFSATANSSGSMSSELLDDYEEGTFTPAYACTVSANATVNTYNNQNGYYVKVGDMVFCTFSIGTTSMQFDNGQVDNNSSHRMRITGLPFTSSNTSLTGGGSLYLMSSFGTVTTGITLGVVTNDTQLMMRNQGDTSSYNGNYLDDVYTANFRSHSSGEGNMMHATIYYRAA